MSSKLLIVEDDSYISEMVQLYLTKEGYDIKIASDGVEAISLFKMYEPDLVLLDIMLPRKDGWAVCKEIRQISSIPIIMVTAKGEVFDKVLGLELGADDYIVKPFQSGEVLARMEAVLRRYGKNAKQLSFADVKVDTESRRIFQNGKEIELTVKKFDLLVELIQNKNIAQYRDKLYEKVWNEPFMGDTRTLDTHIQRLRKKLGWEDYIKTVFRIGYRLEG